MPTASKVVVAVRWVTRLLALALFLFWGGFFVEHLKEWFIQPFPQTPPLKVWIGQTLHLLILIGLLIGLRWELAGGLLVVIASTLFFVDKEPAFIPLAILPGLLYVACWFGGRLVRRQSRA